MKNIDPNALHGMVDTRLAYMRLFEEQCLMFQHSAGYSRQEKKATRPTTPFVRQQSLAPGQAL